MKNIVVFFIVLLITFDLVNSQNLIDPTPIKFSYKDDFGTQHNTDTISHNFFPQRKFLIGWQWGDLPRVSYEVSSNMSMGGDDMSNYHPWGNTPFFNLVTQTSFMLDNAASFQYEPTLLIPTLDRGKLVFRPDDRQHSVFGFLKSCAQFNQRE